jgi:O-methyltransferase involved in polyketide biosynthesis
MDVAVASSDHHTLFPPISSQSTSSRSDPAGQQIVPGLADVSETMLWTLYNRATEAERPDGVLNDPASIAIHRAIEYDFGGHFGNPAGSLAARAAAIDQAIRHWLMQHPDGMIVSLGEGLETQAYRVDNGRMHWLSVDLPDAIRLRENFLRPSPRFHHLSGSALDLAWMDAVDPAHGVFIVAQGLLMYLSPEKVRQLLSSIAERFPGGEIVFDTVPRWFSHLTMIGFQQTPRYRLPPMPWGANRNELGPTLRRWNARLADVAFLDYDLPRGPLKQWTDSVRLVPLGRNDLPSLAHIRIATVPCVSTIRKQAMTSNNAGTSGAGMVSDMIALATRTAASGSDLAIAAGQVIARRIALGAAAAVNPLTADHAEFARMVPEKVEAFSAAGRVMFEQSEEVRSHLSRVASDEVMTATRATMELANCRSPAAVLEAQGRFAHAWFERTMTQCMTIGMMALGAQAAMLAPLQTAVAANTERLG